MVRLSNVLKPVKGIDGPSFSVLLLKELLRSWVQTILVDFSWSASTSSTEGWKDWLSIDVVRVLDLCMGIESGVAQVSFVTFVAFE